MAVVVMPWVQLCLVVVVNGAIARFCVRLVVEVLTLALVRFDLFSQHVLALQPLRGQSPCRLCKIVVSFRVVAPRQPAVLPEDRLPVQRQLVPVHVNQLEGFRLVEADTARRCHEGVEAAGRLRELGRCGGARATGRNLGLARDLPAVDAATGDQHELVFLPVGGEGNEEQPVVGPAVPDRGARRRPHQHGRIGVADFDIVLGVLEEHKGRNRSSRRRGFRGIIRLGTADQNIKSVEMHVQGGHESVG
mmetsp:Transcript_7426/g.21594  ORF Transcript_7426/g.21594 Transcript_7426/m.21594 type:complete len:248 (-) Transcript_7426:820-1563(-)